MKTAVEIGNEIIELPRVVPSVTMAKGLTILAISEFGQISTPDSIKEGFLYQILTKRIQFHEIPVNEYVIGLLDMLSDRAGVAVMWVAVCKAIYEKEKQPITLRVFTRYFGDGYPSTDDLHTVWVNQKIGGANMLDSKEAWV